MRENRRVRPLTIEIKTPHTRTPSSTQWVLGAEGLMSQKRKPHQIEYRHKTLGKCSDDSKPMRVLKNTLPRYSVLACITVFPFVLSIK